MILHNDIWGDTDVAVIEEIDQRFFVVRELNMLALYSKLDAEQSKNLKEALATYYDILFGSKDKSNISDVVPFAPELSCDNDGNGYLCLVRPAPNNSVTDLRKIAKKIIDVECLIDSLSEEREAIISYEIAQLVKQKKN